MRILLTADPMLPVPPVLYGGIERVVAELLSAYRSSGHVVALAARSDSGAEVDAFFPWPIAPTPGVFAIASNALALRRAVRQFRPDIVHSFSRLAYLAPLLPSNLPKVMSYQRHTGGRGITMAAQIGRHSIRFTGCSDFICAMGRRAGGRWHAIPNFVDPGKITFARQVAADAPLVFLSRVESIKGPHLAIAIAQTSGRRLVIAGNHADRGPEREYWDTTIAPHLGRDGIEYVGEVDDVQKNALLGRAAALVVPIQWDEPFGIVFPEALAAGTPVITCARGALPEIIEPGVTGFFITSVEDGVAAVRRLDALDRAACRRAAEDRFSVSVCAAQYLALYRQMLGSSAGPTVEGS